MHSRLAYLLYTNWLEKVLIKIKREKTIKPAANLDRFIHRILALSCSTRDGSQVVDKPLNLLHIRGRIYKRYIDDTVIITSEDYKVFLRNFQKI